MGLVRRFQAWRRYRLMARRLAELDRLDRESAAGPEHRPRRRRVELLFVVSVVLIVGLYFAAAHFFPGLVQPPRRGPHTRPPSTAATGPYAFLSTTPAGRPVSYDPCRPIHYVVNPAGMPDDGLTLIHDAVQEVGAASGLRFVDDGLTQERPDPRRATGRPHRPGQGWPPVLVAWATHAEYPAIGGDIEGVGGSTSFEPNGPESARYVTGEVVLDRDGLAAVLAEGDGDVQARAIVIHELAHVVGLGHVDDPGELMAPRYTGLTGLGPGDRQGLAILGKGPCWPGG